MSRVVAKFERVSFEQYCEDAGYYESDFAREKYYSTKIPKRATKGSAGYDFFAPEGFTLEPNQSITFPTCIRCKMEESIVLMLYPRSGQGFKYRVRLENTVGVIDSDYYNSGNEGHIFIKLTNEGHKTMTVKAGEAYMQGILQEYFLAEEDDVTEERNGGFGSTSR